MESDSSNLCGSGSAITVTTKIIRSDSPPIRGLTSRKHGSKSKRDELHKSQQNVAKAATRSKRGSRTRPVAIEIMQGNEEPCAGPIIPDTRNKKAVPLPGLQNTFEESPEWRQHYGPISKTTSSTGPYLADNQSGVLPDRSLMNPRNFSAETIRTAKTLSERSSTGTADLSSKRLLCLPCPSPRRNILKAGNIRFKQFITPRGKKGFETQPTLEHGEEKVGQLQKLDLNASKRHLPRRGSKSRMERIVSDEKINSQEAVLNKESNTSIVDLNQVEARHGLETYHRTTLSESWDEIFRSIGGFGADAAVDHGDDDDEDDASHSRTQSILTEIDTTNPNQRATAHQPSKRKSTEPQKIPAKAPPLPGPRSSSVTALAGGLHKSRSFQVVVAGFPGRPVLSRQCVPKPVKIQGWPAEPETSFLRVGESLAPRGRESRFSEGFSQNGPAPGASPSSIALDPTEAEVSNGRPLAPSILTKLQPPFSINCTPPQPVEAPTDPPNGPLPKLPKEFGIADAASRASSHHTSSTRPSRPIIPPRSHHRRNPSVNSASSTLTLPGINAPKVHHCKNNSASTQNLHKSSSLASAQSTPARGISGQTRPQQKLSLPSSNSANITGFNQYNLGNSQDLRSPTISEISQEKEMAEVSVMAAGQPPLLAHDVLLSRSKHIRSLKLRDLAKEKATRTRSRLRGSDLDDAIVAEKPCSSADDETEGAIVEPAHLPLNAGRPSDSSKNTKTGDPDPSSQQDIVTRRPSYSSGGSSSHRTSQRTVRPTMSSSQIMVLAETDPDSQTFRAATPTGSLRGTEGRIAKSVAAAKERKVGKRTSQSSHRSEAQAAPVSKGRLQIKPHSQSASAHSGLSTHSSDGDVEGMQRITSHRRTNHHVAPVKEDSDIESAPSTRAFAALADIEEKKYLEEQLLLTKLRRGSSELKLALKLLSRGLEKLTAFVEADEELNRLRGYGLTEAEMKSARGFSKRLERSLNSDTWERFGPASAAPVEDNNTGKGAGSDRNTCIRQAKNIKANDARPLSLVGRYGNIRHGIVEGVAGAPAVKDEMIWTEVDRLNRAPTVNRGP